MLVLMLQIIILIKFALNFLKMLKDCLHLKHEILLGFIKSFTIFLLNILQSELFYLSQYITVLILYLH